MRALKAGNGGNLRGLKLDISIDTLASQQNALFGLDDNGLRGLSTHPRRVKITRVAIDIASVIADRRPPTGRVAADKKVVNC